MTDKRQSDALHLADIAYDGPWTFVIGVRKEIAAELRRLHAENETLRAGYAAARLEIEPLKAQQPGAVYAALSDEGEPWRGHKFKEVQRGCWRCDCGKTIKEVTSDKSTPASGGNYPVMPKRYTVDDDGEELFTAEKMRAFADTTCAMRASHGQAPAQTTPAYKDGTPELHIGDSAFESWYSSYSPAHKSDKQRARDAYAAGMGDPLVTAAPAAVAGQSEAVKFTDQSTADPVEKARRYLKAMGNQRTNSAYFYDDGYLRRESAQDALATLAVLEQLAAAPTTQAAPQQSGVGNGGFDHKTASDFLAGKTVSDEAMRKFVAASRWAHDDRAGLRATLLSVRNELASRFGGLALQAMIIARCVEKDQAGSVLEDADRYRWLRNPTTNVALVLDKRTGYVPEDERVPGVGGYHTYEYRAGDELDAAIDAARAAQEGKK